MTFVAAGVCVILVRACCLALVGLLAEFGPAHALAISATPVTSVSTAPFRLADFGTAGTNGLVSNAPVFLSNGSVTFAGGGGVYSGNVGGVAASPTTGANYLAAEPGGAVTFSFRAPMTQFQLLWGTVDGYNSLAFVGSDGSTQIVTGSDIQAAGGTNGSAYVTISGLNAFTKVIASSSSPAFEFLPNVQVPEPGTLALVGIGLGGLAWMRRRRT